MKLDLVDKKLLLEIDMNARESLGQLGRKLRLSKRGVDYKLKKFEKEKIILGYKSLIDSGKLGYYFLRMMISFSKIDEKIRKEFELFIKTNKQFAYVFRCQGEHDYACAIWTKSLVEFNELADHIRFQWKDSVKKVDEHIPIYITHLQNRFLLGVSETKELTISCVQPLTSKIDHLERGVLKILADNARTPVHEIAANLRANAKQISYRIKKLEREGIILGYRAVINYKAIGYSYFKCMLSLKNIDQKEFIKIKQFITMKPQIIFLNHGIGFPTLDFSAIFLTINEFYDFIEDIKKTFPNKIEDYTIILFGENVKYDYVPFLG
ncbi:hypothetical protein COV18_02360 [Candidatus Woesearchaeota archaeon CG10_big_fil_rev_8_21_14_0_10_37_12]|nr:MAG: hypothetical protein COV18_02360 [Candidatus Woesearchaeota archaeon CG10_big_fil_rev_8_21_14_0_10_37_12]